MVRKINTRQGFAKTNFTTRSEEDGKKYIEGYFIRYNEETELWPGVYEEVGQGSLAKSLKDNDIRALFNHNSEIVLGRTGNSTVKLEDKKEGLWGSIEINPNDKQANDIHARVERGDIDGSSFGFNIINEETINRDDGTVKFILKEIDLHEVSPCTFPAYPTTAIQARKKDYSNYKQRQLDAKKSKLKERLKNVKTIND